MVIKFKLVTNALYAGKGSLADVLDALEPVQEYTHNAENLGGFDVLMYAYRFEQSCFDTPELWQRVKGPDDNKRLIADCEDYNYERDNAQTIVAHAANVDASVFDVKRVWLLQQLGFEDRAFHVMQQTMLDCEKPYGRKVLQLVGAPTRIPPLSKLFCVRGLVVRNIIEGSTPSDDLVDAMPRFAALNGLWAALIAAGEPPLVKNLLFFPQLADNAQLFRAVGRLEGLWNTPRPAAKASTTSTSLSTTKV